MNLFNWHIFNKYKHDIYLLLLSLISFTGWVLENEAISVPFFIGIIWLVVLRFNPLYLFPVPLFTIPIFASLLKDVGKIGNADSVVNFSMLAMIVGGVSALIFDIIKHKRFQQKGQLFLPYTIFLITVVISLINAPSIPHSLAGVAIYGFMLFFYVYFLNSINSADNEKIFFAKTIVWYSLLTSVMTLWVIALDKTVVDNILKKDINIGWSISNNIATYLVYAIPFLLYLSIQQSAKFIYFFLVLFITVVVFLTGSRAGVGGILILALPCFVYTFYNSDKKILSKHVLLASLLLVPLIFIAFYLDIPEALYKRLFLQKFFFYFKDRKQLLDIAWNAFLQHPIIGTGIFSAGHYIAVSGRKVFSYHNVFFEVLATIGILGSLAASIFVFYVGKLFFNQQNTFKNFGLIAILGSSIFSIFDTAYANPIYLYMVFCFFAFIEKK